MAKEKRMFNRVITKQDEFLDMPSSAQALYFHLNLDADDEGFVNNVKSVMRQVRASEDDLKILLAKRYILGFQSGVVVIKHWLIHNTIRGERIIETVYKEEKDLLEIKENQSYTEKKEATLMEEIGVSDTVSDKCTLRHYTNLNSFKSLNSLSFNIKEIIEYLNSKTNSRYRYDNTRTNSLLKARLENYSVDDIKRVIDLKCKEWLGNKDMEKYLRPETLFNATKFESYVNQKETKQGMDKTIDDLRKWAEKDD